MPKNYHYIFGIYFRNFSYPINHIIFTCISDLLLLSYPGRTNFSSAPFTLKDLRSGFAANNFPITGKESQGQVITISSIKHESERE